MLNYHGVWATRIGRSITYITLPNKAQYIDLALHEEILSYNMSDLAVRVHGDTGIVTGASTVSGG